MVLNPKILKGQVKNCLLLSKLNWFPDKLLVKLWWRLKKTGFFVDIRNLQEGFIVELPIILIVFIESRTK
jgi:hypothetical protein